MRQAIFFLLLLCAIINSYAQERYILSGVFLDGRNLKDNDILFFNDSCTFRVTDQAGVIQTFKSCEWEFKILQEENDANYYETIKTDNKEFLKIAIDSVMCKIPFIWWYVAELEFEGDRSIYYSTLVTCKGELESGDKIYLEKPILLNLLPSRPIVKVLDFKYSFYDSQYFIYEDGLMTLQIIGDRCDKGLVTESSTSGWSVTSSILPFNIDPVNQIGSVEAMNSDSYLRVAAYSQHGMVYSKDTIWMSSFIPTSTDNILVNESISFYPNPVKDILFIRGSIDDLLSIDVLNSMGQSIKQIINISSTIDISDLANGIYFLSYIERNTQKRKAFKFLKTQ